MKFENFIWDFDGTLFNTYPATLDAFEITLKDFGVFEYSRDEIYDDTRKTITFALENLIKKYDLNRIFVDKFWENANKVHPKYNVPFENAIICCKKIKDNNLNNFIITHRDKRSTHEILRYYGVFDLFKEIITEENGFENKPNPESFLYVIGKYDLILSKTLCIGDRELDIKAGKNSNIKTCFMNFDNSDNLLEADFVFNSFNEFINKFI